MLPLINETSDWAQWLSSLQPGEILSGGEEKRNSEPSYPSWTEEPVHKILGHYKYFMLMDVDEHLRNKDNDPLKL